MFEMIYPIYEKLKKHNPWKDYFQDKSDDEILCRIVAWDYEFIHPDDVEAMSRLDNGKKNKTFVYNKLPKPYRGNLKDPKLVILSLNPGFNERVNRTLFDMLSPEFQKEFIKLSKDNLFLEDGCRIISKDKKVDDVLDNGYWTKQLSDIAKINDNYLDKIGLIQFIPYASKNYDSWDGEDRLGTQDFTKEIIIHLLEETHALFLVMRAKEQWEKLIRQEMHSDKYKDRFLYNRNPRCQKLSRRNLMYENAPNQDQFQMILDVLEDKKSID